MEESKSESILRNILGKPRPFAHKVSAQKPHSSDEEDESDLISKYKAIRDEERKKSEAQTSEQTAETRAELEKKMRKQTLNYLRRGKEAAESAPSKSASIGLQKKKILKMRSDIAKYKHTFRGHKSLAPPNNSELTISTIHGSGQRTIEILEVRDLFELERENQRSKRLGAKEDYELLVNKRAS